MIPHEPERDDIQLRLRVAREFSAFRNVRSKQSVAIFTRRALPRVARIAEIDLDSGGDWHHLPRLPLDERANRGRPQCDTDHIAFPVTGHRAVIGGGDHRHVNPRSTSTRRRGHATSFDPFGW